MAYLVLARKWRPQDFEEVVGQPHVAKTLQNAIRSKRIAHAYLFTGARGVGKTSVARILSKALNCERGPTPTPCNECSNCREITQGNAVDVLEIDGASNRGIDSIRELRETVRYRPAKSRYKVYIIDEVHMLTTEAFNALLKTLEEPPEHVMFIFATTEPHKIPTTILSRCQRFDFRRIPTHQIVGHLKRIVDAEQAGLSDAVIYAVAREADGSMRDSQSLLEQLLSFSGDEMSDEEILDVLGVVDRRSVHRVGEAILEGDVRTCLRVVAELYRRGIDSRRFCQQLCDHFRNLLFMSLGESEGASQLDLPEDEKRLLKEQMAKTTSDSLYLCFQMVLKGEEEIRRSSLPRITLEMLLLRLTQLPSLESLGQVLEKLNSLEERLDWRGERPRKSGGAHQQATIETPVHGVSPGPERELPDPASSRSHVAERLEEPPPAPPEPLALEQSMPLANEAMVAAPPEEVVERWQTFIQWLERKEAFLAAMLTHSLVRIGAEGIMELEVPEIYENSVSSPQSQAKLANAVRGFFGQEFRWVVRSRATLEPGSGDAAKPKKSRLNARRIVMESPVVQQAIEILGGELQEIRLLDQDGRKPRKRSARSGAAED